MRRILRPVKIAGQKSLIRSSAETWMDEDQRMMEENHQENDPPIRCYHCRQTLTSAMVSIRTEESRKGWKHLSPSGWRRRRTVPIYPDQRAGLCHRLKSPCQWLQKIGEGEAWRPWLNSDLDVFDGRETQMVRVRG